MKLDSGQQGNFLYLNSLPLSERQPIQAQLRKGDIYVVRLTTRDEKGRLIRAPGGWLHHWLAAMFVPGATLRQAVAVGQEFDQYASFYQPEIVRSRVLEHNDNSFKVYVRLQKKTPWVTITLDTYNDVHYVFLNPQALYSVSRSYRVQQVDNAGRPDERIEPPGRGEGFLWATDIFWRYEAVRGGIMVESETIALTRKVPFGLGWIIKPFVERAAVATDKQMMIRTRQIIRQEARKENAHKGGGDPLLFCCRDIVGLSD